MWQDNSTAPELAKALKKLAPALSEVAAALEAMSSGSTAEAVQKALNQEINAKASKSTHSAILAKDGVTVRGAAEKPAEDDLKPSDEDKKAAPTNPATAGGTEPQVLPPLSEACATPLSHPASTATESPDESRAAKSAEGLDEAVKFAPPSDAEVAAARAERMSECTKLYQQLMYLGWDEQEARVEARRFIAELCKKVGAPVTSAGELPYEFHEAFMEGLNAKLYEVRK